VRCRRASRRRGLLCCNPERQARWPVTLICGVAAFVKSCSTAFGFVNGAILLAGLLPLIGCGNSDRTQISGHVTHKDGSPLVGARVAFRSPETGQSAMGFTDANGRYMLGTSPAGEGVLPGQYEVTVAEDRGPVTNPRPRTIHPGYEAPQTSPLKVTVEPGGSMTYDIVVQPP